MVREPLDDDRRRLLSQLATNPALTRLDGGLVAVVLTLLPMIACAGLAGGSPASWIAAGGACVALLAVCVFDRASWRRAVVGCLARELEERRLAEVALPDVDAPRDARWPLVCDLLRRTAARDAGDGRLRRSCEVLQHALAQRLADVARLSDAEAFDQRFDPQGTGPAATRLRAARREAEERLEVLLDAVRRLHAEAMAAEDASGEALGLVQSELGRIAASRETDAVARPLALNRAL